MGITYLVAFLIKTGWIFKDFVNNHIEFADAFVGLVFPVTILLIIELVLWKKEKDPGWDKLIGILGEEKELVDESKKEKNKLAGQMYSNMALKLMMGTYLAIGVIMIAISLFGSGDREYLLLYGVIFSGISLISLLLLHVYKKKNTINKQYNGISS